MERKVEHKSVSRQVEEIKALSEDILEYRSIDVQKAWLRMERRVGRQAVRRTLSLLFTRAAVILVLPLLFSSLLFSYLYYATRYDEKSQPVVYAEVNSLPGTITRFVLPDQSVVWLNSGSKLTYPSVFEEKERKVLLSGEGYFEVEADPEHPFCVSTSEGLRVVAYGTKFNVNAYADEPFIEAVLEKGKNDVIRNDERIRLEPNKQAVLDKESGTFSVSAANLEEKMDWKGGRIVFRNTSLDKVLKRLEKRYNVEIVLHKSGNAEYKYRATFTTETLEQILDYLKQTAPIEWTSREPSQRLDSSFVRRRIDVYQR